VGRFNHAGLSIGGFLADGANHSRVAGRFGDGTWIALVAGAMAYLTIVAWRGSLTIHLSWRRVYATYFSYILTRVMAVVWY